MFDQYFDDDVDYTPEKLLSDVLGYYPNTQAATIQDESTHGNNISMESFDELLPKSLEQNSSTQKLLDDIYEVIRPKLNEPVGSTIEIVNATVGGNFVPAATNFPVPTKYAINQHSVAQTAAHLIYTTNNHQIFESVDQPALTLENLSLKEQQIPFFSIIPLNEDNEVTSTGSPSNTSPSSSHATDTSFFSDVSSSGRISFVLPDFRSNNKIM